MLQVESNAAVPIIESFDLFVVGFAIAVLSLSKGHFNHSG
jgi:hypothetical protein